MKKEWNACKKIVLYGTANEIKEAEQLLDSLSLDTATNDRRLKHEGEIRIQIQDAMEEYPLKADIIVDGSKVYPLTKTIQAYERCRKSGSLERMSTYLYHFLSMNFDIAHYSKRGYIAFYGRSFSRMKKEILDRATVPGWRTDLKRILDIMQGRAALADYKKKEGLKAA